MPSVPRVATRRAARSPASSGPARDAGIGSVEVLRTGKCLPPPPRPRSPSGRCCSGPRRTDRGHRSRTAVRRWPRRRGGVPDADGGIGVQVRRRLRIVAPRRGGAPPGRRARRPADRACTPSSRSSSSAGRPSRGDRPTASSRRWSSLRTAVESSAGVTFIPGRCKPGATSSRSAESRHHRRCTLRDSGSRIARPPRQQELAGDRLDRDHVRVEREHERRGRQRRGVQLDDLLALPGTNLPRAGEAPEGREVLVLDDDPQRQLGPLREVAPDQLRLVGARHDEQLVEQPRRAEVREGAEQQVEARQVVAVVPAADLQRQQGAELRARTRSRLAAGSARARLPLMPRREVVAFLVVRRRTLRSGPAYPCPWAHRSRRPRCGSGDAARAWMCCWCGSPPRPRAVLLVLPALDRVLPILALGHAVLAAHSAGAATPARAWMCCWCGCHRALERVLLSPPA